MTTIRTTAAPCPSWCQRHRDDHADNASDHATEPIWVPAVLLRRSFDADHERVDLTAADLLVVLVQPVEAAEPWIHIGKSDDSAAALELSVGSTRRLLRAIGDQLSSL